MFSSPPINNACTPANDCHLEISVTADFLIPKTNNGLNKLYWCKQGQTVFAIDTFHFKNNANLAMQCYRFKTVQSKAIPLNFEDHGHIVLYLLSFLLFPVLLALNCQHSDHF